MIYSRITPNLSNIHFEGLKENKRVGEDTIREFHKEFGYPKSSSMLENKLAKYANNKSFSHILPKIEEKASNLFNEIYSEDLCNIVADREKKTKEEFLSSLKKIVKKKNKANCTEDMFIMNSMLSQKGEKPQNLQITIIDYKKEYIANHSTTVFGLKPGANISKPATWGNKAVIADAWSGITMEAKDALEYFKESMGYNPKTSELFIIDA